MKHIKFVVGLIALLLSQSVAMAASPQLVVAGHKNRYISIVDLNSERVVWSHHLEDGEQCNSLHLINKGRDIVYSTQLSAKIVSIETNEVKWSYVLADKDIKGELHSVYPLSDGGLALFVSGTPARVIELTPDYEESRVLEFDAMNKNIHGQFRQVTVSKSGNYLIPIFSKKSVLEMNREGEILTTHDIGAVAFSLTESSDGTWLFGTGDGHTIREYDPATKSLVREITDLESIEMLYMAKVERIGKDRIMAANWSGHNKKELTRPAPQIFEMDSDFKVVWSWSGDDLAEASTFVYSKKRLVK